MIASLGVEVCPTGFSVLSSSLAAPNGLCLGGGVGRVSLDSITPTALCFFLGTLPDVRLQGHFPSTGGVVKCVFVP